MPITWRIRHIGVRIDQNQSSLTVVNVFSSRLIPFMQLTRVGYGKSTLPFSVRTSKGVTTCVKVYFNDSRGLERGIVVNGSAGAAPGNDLYRGLEELCRLLGKPCVMEPPPGENAFGLETPIT